MSHRSHLLRLSDVLREVARDAGFKIEKDPASRGDGRFLVVNPEIKFPDPDYAGSRGKHLWMNATIKDDHWFEAFCISDEISISACIACMDSAEWGAWDQSVRQLEVGSFDSMSESPAFSPDYNLKGLPNFAKVFKLSEPDSLERIVRYLKEYGHTDWSK